MVTPLKIAAQVILCLVMVNYAVALYNEPELIWRSVKAGLGAPAIILLIFYLWYLIMGKGPLTAFSIASVLYNFFIQGVMVFFPKDLEVYPAINLAAFCIILFLEVINWFIIKAQNEN